MNESINQSINQSISQLIPRWETNTEIHLEGAGKGYVHKMEFAPYC